jgi:enterochelin esterase-like enzyme
MGRVAGTDLWYATARMPPGARVAYRFVKDFDERTADPLNPRRVRERAGETSWVATAGWREPAFLGEAPAARRGRLVAHELESERHAGKRRVEVYLPAGFEPAGGRRYPVASVHNGGAAVALGGVPGALDHLIGGGVEPLIAVFIHPLEEEPGYEVYLEWMAKELVPFVDRAYPTDPRPERRASVGMGGGGGAAHDAALAAHGLFGRVAVQSPAIFTEDENRLKALAAAAAGRALAMYFERSRWDLRAELEAWDIADTARALAAYLRQQGFQPVEHEALDGYGWGSWRNRYDRVFGFLFPAPEAG